MLLYKPDTWRDVLGTNNKRILAEYEYKGGALIIVFVHAKYRFAKEDFPHEIDLFLRYPGVGVEVFIRHARGDYILL